MKEISFYKNSKGECQITNYMKTLALKNDKDSRINLGKISDYITALSYNGVKIGMPYVKHIFGKIWELRPLRNRILFFEYKDKIVMLHLFIKDTQKTPKEEIIRAVKEMNDYLIREEKR